MEYLGYSLEQIKNRCFYYDKLCNVFFSLCPDENTRLKMEEVLYKGSCNGFEFVSNIANKNNPSYEAQRRISMAYLLIRNPKTFDFFIENKLNVFHGTNANALPSILKYGLNSGLESDRNGINISTGERSTRIGRGRAFVSFADILEISCGYSTLNAINGKEELSFSVILATSVDDIESVGSCIIDSDIPEIGVLNGFPIEKVKAICVPTEKVDFVKRIVGNMNIAVLAMDDFERKFYWFDERNILFAPDCGQKIEELKNEQNKLKKKQFSLSELKSISSSRLFSSVVTRIENIKNILEGNELKNGR